MARLMQARALKPVVIWLHGSGDTGAGASEWVRSLAPEGDLAAFDWQFPDAEAIPYSLSGGAVSSVWYDRVGGFEPRFPEQTASVERSAARVLAAIDAAVERGVPPARIAVGGFSMGGNLAYQVAARYHAAAGGGPGLGAVFCLSGYAADDSKLWKDGRLLARAAVARWPPVFVAHGAADDFIRHEWGRATFDRLARAGVDASFRLVPGVQHQMHPAEIAELLAFLRARFTAGDAAP